MRRKERKKAKPRNLRGFIRNETGVYVGNSFRVVDYHMFKGFEGLIRRVYPGAMSMADFYEYCESLRYDKRKQIY
ncbi:hypothetical protein [Sphingobacterium multivorum]|uniref:hypothetical protein n=1 Tax=Sphingobacterium multivorum TaxID=28454 RepID=UPI0028A0201C|nr:hypothetical protein [Sphingobacterium multivorum]